jgi:hypothetical protein
MYQELSLCSRSHEMEYSRVANDRNLEIASITNVRAA